MREANRRFLVVAICVTALVLVTIALSLTLPFFDHFGIEEVLPETTVRLPFGSLWKNSFFLDIDAVPEDPESIKIKVYVHWVGEQTKEWIQNGPGTFDFVLDGGKEKYRLRLHELHRDGDSIGSVKISIQLGAADFPTGVSSCLRQG